MHIFANTERDLPPVKDVGDFLFLHNVEIVEWEGGCNNYLPNKQEKTKGGGRITWHRSPRSYLACN